MDGRRILSIALLGVALLSPYVKGGKVLLISLDGFRWDYISKTSTPNFDALISDGVHVNKVQNAFATVTMPNHYTLVTGLYEEQHGIINNRFWDPNYNDEYRFSTDTKWFNSTEPIWITAEREGKKSGAYMWVGNQAEYDGVTVSKVTPFDSKLELKTSIDVVVDWFKSDQLQLACLYNDYPDKTGHSYGPDSDELKAKIRELDEDIGYLRSELEKAGLSDEINIIITSDHGMTNVAPERTIDMSQYLNLTKDSDLVEWSYFSANGLIIPRPGMKQQVFDALNGVNDHFTVYKREDIPEDLHYKNNDRIPEIVVIPEMGWILKSRDYTFTLKGQHGFDNKYDDMKSTFVAYGPDFKCGYKQEEMRSVDLYPLMCKVLGLTTCHQSPGVLSKTEGFLSDENCHISAAPRTLGGLGSLIASLLFHRVMSG